ncbi:MAG: FecR domain-containing protein [Spirochaetes bacterium]|nr:FecR domain-containing protein [Spirochaetota bacterium]
MNKTGYLILILILLSLFSCLKQSEDDDYSKIMFYIGDVKKNSLIVEIGDIILENDIITTGIKSSCDIKIGGSIIRVKEKSKIKLSELSRKDNIERTTVGLSVGKLLCKAKKLSRSEKFMVKTPTAVAGVRGTKFTVEADPKRTSRIKVFNGKVKVIKRIKQLEEEIDKVLDAAPSLSDKEKVIVTEKEVEKAEKIVKKFLDKEQKISGNVEIAVVRVIENVKDDVVVSKKEIRKFKVEDFKEEQNEIIEVKEKPKEIIQQIKKIVELEKKEPVPEGRLLITRYEIHFIKDGRLLWEGRVINPPLKKDDKLYIASGDYIFCASLKGPVFWKKKIENNGKIEIKDDKLIVYSRNKTEKLDLVTGL